VKAIFQGRRYRVASRSDGTVSVKPFQATGKPLEIPTGHIDLILDPTADDLSLAEAFERGEIGAFEYPDGHTFPANREIGISRRQRRGSKVH
jgi:hypothetical protein